MVVAAVWLWLFDGAVSDCANDGAALRRTTSEIAGWAAVVDRSLPLANRFQTERSFARPETWRNAMPEATGARRDNVEAVRREINRP
jgi:hypothetical protein